MQKLSASIVKLPFLVAVSSTGHCNTPSISHRIRGLVPQLLQQSLTWDRGTEMAAHSDFSMATNMDVYFCDPQSPWQWGTNENTNGLLRQYFPKGSCLSVFLQRELDKIAAKLNNRPRKTLGFQTPTDKLAAMLQ